MRTRRITPYSQTKRRVLEKRTEGKKRVEHMKKENNLCVCVWCGEENKQREFSFMLIWGKPLPREVVQLSHARETEFR